MKARLRALLTRSTSEAGEAGGGGGVER